MTSAMDMDDEKCAGDEHGTPHIGDKWLTASRILAERYPPFLPSHPTDHYRVQRERPMLKLEADEVQFHLHQQAVAQQKMRELDAAEKMKERKKTDRPKRWLKELS